MEKTKAILRAKNYDLFVYGQCHLSKPESKIMLEEFQDWYRVNEKHLKMLKLHKKITNKGNEQRERN